MKDSFALVVGCGLAAAWTVACAPEAGDGEGGESDAAETTSQVSEALSYDVIWSDDFNEGRLNRNNWSVAGPNDACFNGEAQAYVDHEDCGHNEHTLCVSGGSLKIAARKVPQYPVSACGGGQRWYRSARMTTKTHVSFNPGQGQNGIRIEARMRLPEIINGSWPAFWMLGDDLNQWPGFGTHNWPEAGEIDIMEMGSAWSFDSVIGSIHYGLGTWSAFDGDQLRSYGPNFAPAINEHDWHTFALDWSWGEMRWYQDGVQFKYENLATLPGNQDFDHGFNILLNFALGGAGGSGHQDPSPDPVNGVFRNNGMAYQPGQVMEIDYVRVYAINNGGGGGGAQPPARVFYGGDSNAASPSDWDFGFWKGDCGAGSVVNGLSQRPSDGFAHAIACGYGSTGTFTGNRTATVVFSGADNRRRQRAGDWDIGYHKGECGWNEYVSGVSMDPSTKKVHALRCAAGSLQNGGDNSCETRILSNGDDRGNMASGDWDPGYYKADCSVGKVVYGVSVHASTGKPHRILCCNW